MALISFMASTVMQAAPSEVWAVLDDFQSWPRWMPAMDQIKVETPPGQLPRQGYRFRLRSGLIHTDMEVVEFTPLTRATSFQISFPPLRGTNSCRLEPLADGQIRIERRDSLELPEPLANFLIATRRERFDRLANEFVLALKRAVEARRAQPL